MSLGIRVIGMFMKRVMFLVLILLVAGIQIPVQAQEQLNWLQCLAEVRRSHPDLRIAAELLRQAEYDRDAANAGQLPSFSLSMAALQRVSTASVSSSLFSYSLQGEQLLFDGSQSSSQLSGRGELVKAARNAMQATAADVRFVLRSAFIGLLKAQELRRLTGEIADRRQKNVRMIRLRYEGGRENLGALRQAEADLAQAQFEVAQADRGIVLGQRILASALGRHDGGKLVVTGSFMPSRQSEAKPDMMQLVEQNPQYRELLEKKKAAAYDLQAARSSTMPQLYATTSLGSGSVNRIPVEGLDWSVGVRLSLPIYAGGLYEAREEKSRSALNQLDAEVRRGYLRIAETLQQSWNGYADASAQVGVSEQFLVAATERARIGTAQYSNGLLSFNDWVMLEDNLVAARKGLLNAGSGLLMAEAQWILSKGEGFDVQK